MYTFPGELAKGKRRKGHDSHQSSDGKNVCSLAQAFVCRPTISSLLLQMVIYNRAHILPRYIVYYKAIAGAFVYDQPAKDVFCVRFASSCSRQVIKVRHPTNFRKNTKRPAMPKPVSPCKVCHLLPRSTSLRYTMKADATLHRIDIHAWRKANGYSDKYQGCYSVAWGQSCHV